MSFLEAGARVMADNSLPYYLTGTQLLQSPSINHFFERRFHIQGTSKNLSALGFQVNIRTWYSTLPHLSGDPSYRRAVESGFKEDPCINIGGNKSAIGTAVL